MKLKPYLFILIFFILPAIVFAKPPVGFGGMAEVMMTPVKVISDFVQTACLVLGIGFIFASIAKYFDHRRSPLMVTMTTVVFLFLAGVVLFLLPLLSYFTSNGIPYSLWRQ